MSRLIPVQYHSLRYPRGIYPGIREVYAHFDSEKKVVDKKYLLYTETAEKTRNFDGKLLSKYKTILENNIDNVAQLWYSEKWSEEFADFVKDVSDNKKDPSIIEIHPPFSDYSNIDKFVEYYLIFEERIKSYFKNTEIIIENLAGTEYKNGKYIFSTVEELIELSDRIDKENLDLKISLDIPNLFEAHDIKMETSEEIFEILDKIKTIIHNIKGIQIWSKSKTKTGENVYFIGDLDNFFEHNSKLKEEFLKKLFETFDDEIERYFVPVVDSGNDDLRSIVNDLVEVGFEFI